MKKLFFTSALMGGLLVGCSDSRVEQASEEFNALPGAVQKSVRTRFPNAEVVDVEKYNRNGVTVYRVEFRDADRHPPMELTPDGTLVKYEAGATVFGRPGGADGVERGQSDREGELSALPLGVQKAIREKAPRAVVVDIRRTEKDGRPVYEIEYAGREPRPVLHVAADGTILKLPAEVDRRD